MGRSSNSKANPNVMKKAASVGRPKYNDLKRKGVPAHAKAIHDADPKKRKSEVDLLTNILHSDHYKRSINDKIVIFNFSGPAMADRAVRTFNNLNYELVTPKEHDKEFFYVSKNNNVVTISREHYGKLCEIFPNKYCLDLDLIFAPLKNTIVENETRAGTIKLPPLQSISSGDRTAEDRRMETINFYKDRGKQVFTDIKHMIDRLVTFYNISDREDLIITVISMPSTNVSHDVTTELNRFSYLANKSCVARCTDCEIFVLRDDLIKILEILSPVTNKLIPDEKSISKQVSTHLFSYRKVETNATKKLRHQNDAHTKKLHKYYLRILFSSLNISQPADPNTILKLDISNIESGEIAKYVNALNCFSYVLKDANPSAEVKIASKRKNTLLINYTHLEELRAYMDAHPIIPVYAVETRKLFLTNLKNPMHSNNTATRTDYDCNLSTVYSAKSNEERGHEPDDKMHIDSDNDSDQEKSQALNDPSDSNLQEVKKLEISCSILFNELEDLESSDSIFKPRHPM